MTIYYSAITNAFYASDIHGDLIPSDAKEISQDKYEFLKEGQTLNQKITSDDQGNPILVSAEDTSIESRSTLERSWRNKELSRADEELNKVQDSDPKAVGSVGDWRTYRKLLRAWPESSDFPDQDKRPVSPDSQ